MKYNDVTLSIAKDISQNCLQNKLTNGECKKCIKECIMLSENCDYPGEMFSKFLETGEFDQLVAYSCNLCNQCKIACPKDFDFVGFFSSIREDFVKENNGKSPMKGHSSINMHQKLGFAKFFSAKVKGVK